MEYLRGRGLTGHCEISGGGFADLWADCYVGVASYACACEGGDVVSGELVWRLDADFEPLGPPDARDSRGA